MKVGLVMWFGRSPVLPRTCTILSLPVDKRGRDALGEHNKQQIIFEGETLVAVLAFMLWKESGIL